MRFDELPEDAQFLGHGRVSVAVLPKAIRVPFSQLGNGPPRPFPNHGQPGPAMGDLVSRHGSPNGLASGRNRLDC